uniref:hypothetical protein n=1 Tax=Pandoraea pnomenusa TaxID=93220 RepID=UPI001184DA5C|nr:hypothetical protein [Pandoraea pnomenusa]
MRNSDLQKARAKVLLQDAKVAELSFATRMSCAFDAVYYYVAQLNESATYKKPPSSPDEQTLLNGLRKVGSSEADIQTAQKLLYWYVNQWELAPPPCSVEDAIAWASRITRDGR